MHGVDNDMLLLYPNLPPPPPQNVAKIDIVRSRRRRRRTGKSDLASKKTSVDEEFLHLNLLLITADAGSLGGIESSFPAASP